MTAPEQNDYASLTDLLETARGRWLKTTEVIHLFTLCKKFRVPYNSKAPTLPRTGMMYQFDKLEVKHFRRDEHEWKTRSNSSAVQEHHEKLKIDGTPVINCTYVRHKTRTTFHRRVYQRLSTTGPGTVDSTVIVHYLDTGASQQEQQEAQTHIDDLENPPLNHPIVMRRRAKQMTNGVYGRAPAGILDGHTDTVLGNGYVQPLLPPLSMPTSLPDPPSDLGLGLDIPMDTSSSLHDTFGVGAPTANDPSTLSPLEQQLMGSIPSLEIPGLMSPFEERSTVHLPSGLGLSPQNTVQPAINRRSSGSKASSSNRGSGSKRRSSQNGARTSTSYVPVTISDVCPSWDKTTGGAKVLLTSPHITLGQTYAVVFGTIEVKAETVMNGVVRCFSPPHNAGTVALRLKALSYNIVQVNDMSFEYRETNSDDSLTALFQSLSDNEFQARLLDRIERLERAMGHLPNLPSALGAIDFSSPRGEQDLMLAYKLGQSRPRVKSEPGFAVSGKGAAGSTSAKVEKQPRRLSYMEQQDLPHRLSNMIVMALSRAREHHPVLVDLVLNSKDNRGLSMAHILSALGDSYTAAMKACMSFGLKLNLKDANGHTPVEWAVARFQYGMASLVRSSLGKPAVKAIQKFQQAFRRKRQQKAATKILSAFRKHKRARAAARIQNVFRKHLRQRAATKIQAAYKGHRVRGVAKNSEKSYPEQWRAASLIQDAYRSHQVLTSNTDHLDLLSLDPMLESNDQDFTFDEGENTDHHHHHHGHHEHHHHHHHHTPSGDFGLGDVSTSMDLGS